VNGERIRIVHLQEPCRALKQRSPHATIAIERGYHCPRLQPQEDGSARVECGIETVAFQIGGVERAGPLLHGDFALVVFQSK
jgi:hypothetical protein